MKKLTSSLLVGTMVLSLTACGSAASADTASTTAQQDSTQAASGAAASDDLGTDLTLYSTMTEEDLDALISGFNQKYPNINVEVVSGTIGETTSRIAAEASDPQGDVVWGGLADSDGDQYKDLFENWTSDNTKDAIEGYSCDNGMYSMDHLSTVCFCVNNDLEKQLGISIKTYEDLTDSKLKGQVLIADPNSSSSAWNNLSNIMAVYGNDSDEAWAYIEKLMPNLVIVDSSSACFKSVQSGEYVVGLTYEDGASKLIKDGATNIRIQYPENGVSASAFGCVVIKGAKHEAAAKAMVDYICSAEGSSYIASQLKTLRMTNKNTEYGSDSYLPKTEDLKWVKRDVTYLSEHKQDILTHWNELLSKVQQ